MTDNFDHHKREILAKELAKHSKKLNEGDVHKNIKFALDNIILSHYNVKLLFSKELNESNYKQDFSFKLAINSSEVDVTIKSNEIELIRNSFLAWKQSA